MTTLLKRHLLIISTVFLSFAQKTVAQVVSLSGGYLSAAAGTVLSMDTLVSSSGSSFSNAGTVSLGNINNAGSLLGSGIYNIINVFSNTGTFTASNSTVNFNGSSNQSIPALSYYNLTASGSSTTKTVTGNLTVAGTLTINSNVTVNLVTNTLGGSLSTAGTGTLKTQNSSATPLPLGKTWSVGVEYGSSAAQTIVNGNYSDLNASGGNRSFDTSSTIGIAGTFTPGSGTFSITGSKIDFNGSGPQNVPAFTFYNATVSGGNTKSVAGNVAIKNLLILGDNTTLALGNNFITLRSDSTNTASIGAVPATAAITYGTGAFTVERYVIGRRKYRMITSSVTTSANATLTVGEESKSIWGMWQNSGNNVTANVGTIITGGSAADGFDQQTTTASMYTYDGATRTFKAFSTANGKNTKYTPLKAGRPYYLFVYGDRTNTITTSNPKNTVLTATGTILTGNQVYDSTSAVPISTTVDQYSLLGNPYASTIDWKTVTKSGVSKTIWAWDPNLNAQGGYVTVTDMLNGILIAPLSSKVKISNQIQPGQAFFVKTTNGNPRVTIRESDKVNSTTNSVFRTTRVNPLMAINMLYPSGANLLLADGTVVVFDPTYSNSVTDDDVKKYPGSTEVVSILNSGSLLSVEAKNFPGRSDTILLNMQRLTKAFYTLEIFAQDIGPGIFKATLVDKYLNRQTALSLTDTNRISVQRTVDPLSYSADRFLIVFNNLSVLPVTFTSVKAMRQNDDKIRVDWSVENQVNIGSYAVERSANGANFTGMGVQVANTDITGNYSFTDIKPLNGDNFYRIKSTGNDGRIGYSVIVKVKTEAVEQKMSVYPNPVAGGELNVLLENIAAGTYTIRIINPTGMVMATKEIKHSGGNQTHTLYMPGLAAGNYFVELVQPVNTRIIYKVIKL